ncbi:MAG: uracil-DNA glycosylase family protein [Bacteroidota bacterium]
MSSPTIADKIINFNKSLKFKGKLPKNIHIMNPFEENPEALEVSSIFYKKYYEDRKTRKLILGINPGRFGAGVTGIPFTDTKRLQDKCGLEWHGHPTHETSSVFIYDMIEKYGGVHSFYKGYFINSVSPLGFVTKDEKGKEKNCNYYDSKALLHGVGKFIIASISKIIALGVETEICYCLGTGKNYKYLVSLNQKEKIFNTIIPLEHPRYVMQYKLKKKEYYIDKYLKALCG